jgi:cupin fold WbuC family metalloprotein
MKLLPRALLDELAGKAATSPRARAHHNIHATADDPVQRFVVVATADSYFRPHRHRSKAELAWLLRGDLTLLTFESDGRVSERYRIGAAADTLAYETPQDTWHTLVPGSTGCAFLEVKQGPYDAASAAEFAPWAPPEGDAAVPAYLRWLRAAQPGSRAP